MPNCLIHVEKKETIPNHFIFLDSHYYYSILSVNSYPEPVDRSVFQFFPSLVDIVVSEYPFYNKKWGITKELNQLSTLKVLETLHF